MFRSQQLEKRKYQKGSALVIAIFVIVVMSLLGSALVRMLNAEAETIAYEVLGTRAFQAAQTGLQVKLSELFPLGGTSGSCDADVNVNLSVIEGLENCDVERAECSIDTPIPVDGITYYTIISEGQCDFGGVITSRTLEVKARTL